MTFSDWVAKWIYQMAHVGAGTALAMFIGSLYEPVCGFGSVAIFGAIKEFIFDPLTETPQLSGGKMGDAEDFLFWNVGALVGYAAARIIRWRLL